MSSQDGVSCADMVIRAPQTKLEELYSFQPVGPSVCLSVRCCIHSNLFIFNRISSKFHIWVALIKPWFSLECFCPMSDIRDD